jgi:Helix-turn-helix domain
VNKRRRNRLKEPAANSAGKCGWRVSEFAEAVGLCRATIYNLMSAGRLRSVKSGSARIILTAPAEFLASLAGEGP